MCMRINPMERRVLKRIVFHCLFNFSTGESKKPNLLQNAKNKIFGKKSPDTSVVIENENAYEDVREIRST